MSLTELGKRLSSLAIPECDWEDCTDPGPFGIKNVQLQPKGEKMWYVVPVVRLCRRHYREMNRTGRIKLGFHPAEGHASDD